MKLDVRGTVFHTPSFAIEGFSHALFQWKDVWNLESSTPASLALMTKEDAPPQVDMRRHFRGNRHPRAGSGARDRLRPRRLRIARDRREVGHRGTRCRQKARKQESRLLQHGTPRSLTLKSEFAFSPVLLHIPEDSDVTFSATALDYFPSRTPSESSLFHIYVLSKERHAKLVQEQFEKTAGELEELTRKQESLLEAGVK